MKRTLILVIPLFLAGSLIAGLVSGADVVGQRVWGTLTRPAIAALFIIFLATVAHMACGALKWRAVMFRVAPVDCERVGARFFIFYTCLGAVVAQFVTLYLSTLLVRGLATRWHQQLRFAHGAATSVFEQGFDVVVMLTLAVPTAIAILAGLDLSAWSALITLSMALTGAILAVFVAAAAPVLVRLGGRKMRLGPLVRIQELALMCSNLGLFERELVLKLYFLSLLRYAAMFVRLLTISIAAGYPFALKDMIMAFPIVQSAQIVALTPGNLGIAEWTWTGLLVAFGYDITTAGEFALTARILIYASILVVIVFASVPYILARFRRSGTRAMLAQPNADEDISP